MSKTPRTDARHGCYFAGQKMVPAEFAAQLETELTAAAELAGRLPRPAFVNVPVPDANGNVHRNVSESEYILLRAWALEAAGALRGKHE